MLPFTTMEVTFSRLASEEGFCTGPYK